MSVFCSGIGLILDAVKKRSDEVFEFALAQRYMG